MNINQNEENLLTKEKWDDMSDHYYKNFKYIHWVNISLNMSSIMNIMSSLGSITKKSTILDAGCGPGIQTKLLAESMLKNSVLYAFDISDKMVDLAELEFKNYKDFNSNKENHYERIDIANFSIFNFNKENPLNICSDIESIRKCKNGKIVKLFTSDAENLNIKDEQFDLYLCNLCVNLTSNPEKFFSEAYRVLKPGGQAVFSVWGKKEEMKEFTYKQDLLNELNNLPNTYSNNFKMNDDMQSLRNTLKKVGFKNFKKEYANILFDVYKAQEFKEKMFYPSTNASVKDLEHKDKDKAGFFDQEMNKLSKFIEESEDFLKMNVLIFTVFK